MLPGIALEDVATKEQRGLVSVDGREFPLRAAKLEARARRGFARTRLTQEYSNPYAEPLEVLYTLPLPADGAVVGYTIRLGEKLVRGRIEKRETALQEYRKALEQGRTSGLLEQERADTFTQTLGNLPPGVAVTVEIEVLQPLAFVPAVERADAAWEYRFPTVVGLRYQGAPGVVGDAERLEPERADATGTPLDLELDLEIGDGAPERVAASSPTHSIRVSPGGSTTHVTLAERAALDRDLVVRWSAASLAVAAELLEGRGVEGDDGRYGWITIVPPAVPRHVLARDLVVLIDASGSMLGAPLEMAKEIVGTLLSSLREGDRFELLAFADDVLSLTGGVRRAKERTLAAAGRALRALRAGGGTEMASALEKALTPLRADLQRQVVVVTDGFIGFERDVVAGVLERLPASSRLHVVGVGSAPNRTLTRDASRAGRGLEILASTPPEAARAAARLVRGTVAPVLTEVRLSGSALCGSAPERPRDVFAGEPLRLYVELAPEGGELQVEGRLAERSSPWFARFDVGSAPEGRQQIPIGASYGSERVADVEMRAAAGAPRDAVDDELERLGLRHRIVTRSTSMVAISEDPTVDPSDPRRRQRLAVELPHGVSAEAVGLAAHSGAHALPSAALGTESAGVTLLRQVDIVHDSDVLNASITQIDWSFRRARKAGFTVARIVRRDGDLVVLEFEAPDDGLDVPDDTQVFEVDGLVGRSVTAELDAALSTRAGRVEAGLTVRLALRLTPSAGLRGDPWLVTWTDVAHATHMVVIEGGKRP